MYQTEKKKTTRQKYRDIHEGTFVKEGKGKPLEAYKLSPPR